MLQAQVLGCEPHSLLGLHRSTCIAVDFEGVGCAGADEVCKMASQVCSLVDLCVVQLLLRSHCCNAHHVAYERCFHNTYWQLL